MTIDSRARRTVGGATGGRCGSPAVLAGLALGDLRGWSVISLKGLGSFVDWTGMHHATIPAARPANSHVTAPALEQIDEAVNVLRNGGVIAMPTDTLYALTAAGERRRGGAPRLRDQAPRPGEPAAAVRLRPRHGRAHRRLRRTGSRRWRSASGPDSSTIVVSKQPGFDSVALARRRDGRSAGARQRHRAGRDRRARPAGDGTSANLQRRRRPRFGRRGAASDRRAARPDPGRRPGADRRRIDHRRLQRRIDSTMIRQGAVSARRHRQRTG